MPTTRQRRRRSLERSTGEHAPPDPATLSPTQRERRARIVRVALRMMERSEYDAIQMRDVADEADVALGTLYRYFASKEHLFAAVLVEWSQSLQHHVQSRPLTGDGIPGQLHDLMERVIEGFERLPQFFRLMVVIETTPDPHARAMFRDFVALTHTTFSEPLASLGDEDRRAVLEVLTSVLGGVLRGWAIGQLTSAQVRERMDRAIHLVFSPAPKAKGKGKGKGSAGRTPAAR